MTRVTLILLRFAIFVVVAQSCAGWLFLGACRWWATDPQSMRWLTLDGKALAGKPEIDCARESAAVVRATQAWWVCESLLGNNGDARLPHGAIAWVDLERAEGILIPAEDRYSMDAVAALVPAALPEQAVVTAFWSRENADRLKLLARVATPKGWVGAPGGIEASDDHGPLHASWQDGHFQLAFQEKDQTWHGAIVRLDGALSALPAGTQAPPGTAPAVVPEAPSSAALCDGCRLSTLKPAAADVIAGTLRDRPRWELRYPPEHYGRLQGEREDGDRVELLPGGVEVVSGERNAGIVRDGTLTNRIQTFGFPSGGRDAIWFQRPSGGFRLFDDDGWYVTADANLHRTDPLWPLEQFSSPTPRLAEPLPLWSKVALSSWVLVALPIGIALARYHGKLKRKKLAVALIAAYAFSVFVAMSILSDYVRLMREVPVNIG